MKRGELEKYWKKVIKQGRPAEAKVIDPASVLTAPWVRLKCKYGCEMYGREYGTTATPSNLFGTRMKPKISIASYLWTEAPPAERVASGSPLAGGTCSLSFTKFSQHFLPLDGGGKVGVRKENIKTKHYHPHLYPPLEG